MPAQPDISFVIPVFNKADALPYVIRAFEAQTFEGPVEYIFVDDASRDNSADLLEQLTTKLPAVRIIRNTDNAGPSLRINQGAALAHGRYLCLLDADELIAPDAVDVMLRLLTSENAQMAHGKVRKTDLPLGSARPAAIGTSFDMAISDSPLDLVLDTRGLVRMGWLVETNTFRAAGGCDQRIFIQDEALPLRLAAKARRMIDLRADVTMAPKSASHLSTDKRQQHHDRFFASYYFLRDHPALKPTTRHKLIERCVSTAWKAVRSGSITRGKIKTLFAYGGTKLGLRWPSDALLHQLAAAFQAMNGIRRPSND